MEYKHDYVLKENKVIYRQIKVIAEGTLFKWGKIFKILSLNSVCEFSEGFKDLI